MTRKAIIAGFAAAVAACIGQSAVFAQATPKPMASAAKTTRKMPPRDAKGRFMKASPAAMPMKKTTRKMPPRDAKGRFMKASPTPPAK